MTRGAATMTWTSTPHAWGAWIVLAVACAFQIGVLVCAIVLAVTPPIKSLDRVPLLVGSTAVFLRPSLDGDDLLARPDLATTPTAQKDSDSYDRYDNSDSNHETIASQDPLGPPLNNNNNNNNNNNTDTAAWDDVSSDQEDKSDDGALLHGRPTSDEIYHWFLKQRETVPNCRSAWSDAIDRLGDCSTCNNAHARVLDLWTNDVPDACTPANVAQAARTLSLEITPLTLCVVNALYLIRAIDRGSARDLNASTIESLLRQSAPLDIVWGTEQMGIAVGSVREILADVQAPTTKRAASICVLLSGGNVAFQDTQGRRIPLAKADGNKALAVAVDAAERILPLVNDATGLVGSGVSPTSATVVVFMTSDAGDSLIREWVGSRFGSRFVSSGADSSGETIPPNPIVIPAPLQLRYEVSDTRSVIDALLEVTTSSACDPNATPPPQVLFVVEVVEEGLDTVKAFVAHMQARAPSNNANRPVYWTYFVAATANSFEDKQHIANYLRANAWPGTYWVDDVLPHTVLSRPYGLFLGGTGRKAAQWIVHVKQGSMNPSALPDEFDWRNATDENPPCVYDVYSQGFCGSCWAIAMAESVSGRVCAARRRRDDGPFSAQDILSCVDPDLYGCRGAYMSDALLAARDLGFSHSSCDPYCNGNCSSLASQQVTCSAEVKNGMRAPPTPRCSGRCEDGTPKDRAHLVQDILWLNVNQMGNTDPVRTEALIREYMLKGPVIAGMLVYSDFETYDAANTIYRHNHDPNTKLLGGHAVTLVGWGEETSPNGFPRRYWIAQNSWGREWGNGGYFRLDRGVGGPPYIEDEVYVPTVKMPPLSS